MPKRPGGEMIETSLPTRSQLIPLYSKWSQLAKTPALWPILATVVLGLAFLFTIQIPTTVTVYIDPLKKSVQNVDFNLSPSLWLLGIFLYGAAFYFTYRACGKKMPWYVLAGSAVFTGIFMQSPLMDPFFFIFRKVLPGEAPDNAPLLTTFISYFFGAGMMEELVKALPVLAALYFGMKASGDSRKTFAVREPLDGIMIGAASATGFAFVETMFQYLHNNIVDNLATFASSVNTVAVNTGSGIEIIKTYTVASAAGLQQVLYRGLHGSSGHIAYSGYLGYFIGLAAMKPSKRWKILGIGYLCAATVHGLWDSIPGTAGLVVGLLAYACLGAAILKARELSPNPAALGQSILATGTLRHHDPIAEVPRAAQLDVPKVLLPASPAAGSAAISNDRFLIVGSRRYSLPVGTLLKEPEIPGLRANSGNGVVAQVDCNPRDPSVLGLKNLSSVVWMVVVPARGLREVEPGRTVGLTRGTRINFGSAQGEIQ